MKQATLIRGMAFAVLISTVAGCAGGGTVAVKKTLDNPKYTDHSYHDILVIGVGGSYDNRADFERAMVSRIRAEGATATAYYNVIGRNQPIRRTTVTAAVKARRFDAVLLARIISGSSDGSATGGVVDLFRYDHEELTTPGEIRTSGTVILSAEMFSGPDETRMWAIESTLSDTESIGQIIEEAAGTTIGQLIVDRLIGN